MKKIDAITMTTIRDVMPLSALQIMTGTNNKTTRSTIINVLVSRVRSTPENM
jgi:hypothetical protein